MSANRLTPLEADRLLLSFVIEEGDYATAWYLARRIFAVTGKMPTQLKSDK